LADVTRKLGIAEQIELVAGLRWRILRNNIRRKNNWLDLVGMIAAAFWGGVLIIGVSIALFFAAQSFLSTGHTEWFFFLFLGIFLFWQIFPIMIAGFGVSFQFRTLLRFPMGLGAFYLIALAYGLADFAAIASVCWLLAMTAGVTVANPSVFPTMILIVALFLMMNVTLERLIGSWLERLLARRLTRELLFGLFILSSVSLQFIKPLLDHYQDRPPHALLQILPYLSFLPPALAGHAIAAGADGHRVGVLIGAAGLAVYALLFSGLLWQRFAAQYHGEELSEAALPARAVTRTAASPRAEKSDALGFLSPQVAAVLRKDVRYLLRNGFVLMSLMVPPILVLVFSSQFGGKHPWALHNGVRTDMLFPGMLGYLLLMLMMPAYNCFAYEGKGIQTYFTAPVRFRDVFLGKNLVHSGVLAFETSLAMAVLIWRIGRPSFPVLVATLAGVMFAVVGQFSIANWTSLCFPRKLEFGSMRGQRNSGVAVWIGFGAQLVLGAICSLVLFAGRWTNSPWLPAEAFAALAAAALAGYFASLDAMTDLAEQKKEALIEALCR
jgi:ABC-2 type transport system permease protein